MPSSRSWVGSIAAGVLALVGSAALPVAQAEEAAAAATQAPAALQGDVARGRQIAYTCLGCHGVDDYKNVYPTYDVPRLAGQHPAYIVAALKGYRSQERSHATMHAQASSLSDQDMADVAAYLSGTAITRGEPAVGKAPEKIAQLCQACHGTDGVGITADYPTLSGQHADYLERALLDYKQGRRKNAVMGTFVAQLSEADIKAIAEYYEKQKPGLATVPRRLTLFSAK